MSLALLNLKGNQELPSWASQVVHQVQHLAPKRGRITCALKPGSFSICVGMSRTGLAAPASPSVLHPPAPGPGGTIAMPGPHTVSPADPSASPFLFSSAGGVSLVYVLSSCVMLALMDVELTQARRLRHSSG